MTPDPVREAIERAATAAGIAVCHKHAPHLSFPGNWLPLTLRISAALSPANPSQGASELGRALNRPECGETTDGT